MKRIGSSSHVTKELEVNNYGNIVYPNTVILPLMHTGGHFGRDKTVQKICSRFYWKNMTEEIRSYVLTCEQVEDPPP